ncbi:hypothetical protein T4D_4158 [Trichinella pseudospiralis]|uniref:Uncharacterized protein n=1 Tax=Trichinella pseudospiralis TaxID=6337 RepID=A0A0V1G4X1_TRIPS|nr:hypothetical protein T4D_4158 [Trichinella pseudospiralis]
MVLLLSLKTFLVLMHQLQNVAFKNSCFISAKRSNDDVSLYCVCFESREPMMLQSTDQMMWLIQM